MTTLETVLICFSGVETVLTCIWTLYMRRRTNEFLIFCSQRVIAADAKYDEYNQALGDANVWMNTR